MLGFAEVTESFEAKGAGRLIVWSAVPLTRSKAEASTKRRSAPCDRGRLTAAWHTGICGDLSTSVELDRKNSFQLFTIAPNIKQLSKWVFLCVSLFCKRPIASSLSRSASFSRGSGNCSPSFHPISRRRPSGSSSSSWPSKAQPCWPTMRFGEPSKWSDVKTSTSRPSRKIASLSTSSIDSERQCADRSDNVCRGDVFGTIRMLLRMRLLRIDAAVDLEFLARFSAAIAYLSGARIRVGMHCYFEEGPYRGDLMTHRVLFNPQLHTSEMFEIMIEALGFAPKDFPAFNLKLKIVAEEEPVFSPGPKKSRKSSRLFFR